MSWLITLEKKMLILPQRLQIVKELAFMSFNLVDVPKDMKITKINMHIPLNNSNISSKVHINEIISTWSRDLVSKGKYPPSKTISLHRIPHKSKELIIDVSNFKSKWCRQSGLNHGIVIKFEKLNPAYLEMNPPFIIVDTI